MSEANTHDREKSPGLTCGHCAGLSARRTSAWGYDTPKTDSACTKLTIVASRLWGTGCNGGHDGFEDVFCPSTEGLPASLITAPWHIYFHSTRESNGLLAVRLEELPLDIPDNVKCKGERPEFELHTVDLKLESR